MENHTSGEKCTSGMGNGENLGVSMLLLIMVCPMTEYDESRAKL